MILFLEIFLPRQISHLSARQGSNKSTEQTVLEYGERVSKFITQHSTKNQIGATCFAGGQDLMMRGLNAK